MRWPWKRRAAVVHPASDDAEEATEARRVAEEHLARSEERTAEVHELVEKLRAHRRVNHFAELFGQSFGRPH